MFEISECGSKIYNGFSREDLKNQQQNQGSQLTRSLQDNEEVQTKNTNGRVVLDAQVNVLLNTKAKVAVLREVVTPQLVLTHLWGGTSSVGVCGWVFGRQ